MELDWHEKYAYGGIVIDETRKVLLRSPTGFWGGYEWTFAKGGADLADKSPQETAKREVQEETGYECNIVAGISGEFESETCVTQYFLMQPTGNVTGHDHETHEVRWVSTDEAFELFQRTKPEKGRLRDTSALKSAIELWHSLRTNEL